MDRLAARRRLAPSLLFPLLCTAALACGAASDDALDGEHDPIALGKADGQIDPDSDEARAVLLLVNDPEVDLAELDDDAGLHATAARNIIDERDDLLADGVGLGPDGEPGTADDAPFTTLEQLDAVPFVGSTAFEALLAYAIDEGYLARVQGGGDGGGVDGADVITDVIFSPQPAENSHNARIAGLIAQAQDTIDVAMYSFSDAGIGDALADAAARGVRIRFLFETANEDRRLDADEMRSSKSGRLEADGIDVRYINKIMHHKYVIIDGPQSDPSRAATATIASGSANWSGGAATRYDENTLFLRGHAELALRLQREFNHLWNHSRQFDAGEGLDFGPSELELTDADMADGDDAHAWFTSANFDVTGSGDTFSVTGRNTVSDQLIEAIEGATDSIWIASGHLRHRGISEALMAKAQANPEMDIRVYLDAQEYISQFTHDRQVEDLQECLAEASSESARRNCLDKGFLFGLQVGQSGVHVRYKWYAYRWHFSYALQMHHKYMIVDGDELWTGSYNLSDNAEHNTMENMLHFSGPQFQDLVDAYEGNFASIWNTGRDEDLLGQVREEIATSDVIPLVFDSMALEWDEVGDLKRLVLDHCTQANSQDFRQHPENHKTCDRN